MFLRPSWTRTHTSSGVMGMRSKSFCAHGKSSKNGHGNLDGSPMVEHFVMVSFWPTKPLGLMCATKLMYY